jgi:hypothetical protein
MRVRSGGGNISTDTPHIVGDDKDPQYQFVIKIYLGKGERLSNKSGKTLA